MKNAKATHGANTLRAKRIGIDTSQEITIFMRRDCHVCRSEGFRAHTRVELRVKSAAIPATIILVDAGFLNKGEVGLSDSAWNMLDVIDGEEITVHAFPTLESLSQVRSKIYGNRLGNEALNRIVQDISQHRYSDIHLSAFVAACAGDNMDRAEMNAMTMAMVDAGDRLSWDKPVVADKHCVGGLPGNRTTPIVVAIAAAHGLTIPKTSSRAITSPAGTADMMETLAPVDLDLKAMRQVVESEGGCIVWGSVLSKKIAAGATHLILDLPVGESAKIRSRQAAELLGGHLVSVARSAGICAQAIITDGSQPVGRGIGPALEARDVLSALGNDPNAPQDLRERAIVLAGELIALAENTSPGEGTNIASKLLNNGQAWNKFQSICEAQGGMREPPMAPHTRSLVAANDGRVASIDNRRLSRLAKLAGAPDAKAAGLVLHQRLGNYVARGEPMMTLHSESTGELEYAMDYFSSHADIISLEDQ